MIEFYLLEQLVTFSETGTLSKAAEKLHISQPALSKAMKRLEEIIGVPLFNRSKSHIELNENGKMAVKMAKKALKANSEVITQTRFFYQSQRTFRIGTCTSFIVSKVIKSVQDNYPQIKIQTNIDDDRQLINQLLDYKIDLAVLHEKTANPRLAVHKYFDEELLLTFKKSDPLAKQKEIHFHDLDGMSILAHQGANFWLKVCLDNIKDINLLVQENMGSLEQLVNASELPVFNSTLARNLHQEPKDKITLPIVDKEAFTTYYLVCRKEGERKFDRLFNTLKQK